MISLWVGDLAAAGQSAASLIDHAKTHSLDSHHAFGLGFKGELSATRGDVAAGIGLFRACLDGLQQAGAQTFNLVFLGGLTKALEATGNFEGSRRDRRGVGACRAQ
jgi:hypothetical protein